MEVEKVSQTAALHQLASAAADVLKSIEQANRMYHGGPYPPQGLQGPTLQALRAKLAQATAALASPVPPPAPPEASENPAEVSELWAVKHGWVLPDGKVTPWHEYVGNFGMLCVVVAQLCLFVQELVLGRPTLPNLVSVAIMFCCGGLFGAWLHHQDRKCNG